MPRTPNETPPKQFRLSAADVARLDQISESLSRERDGPISRADAVREAIRREAARRNKRH